VNAAPDSPTISFRPLERTDLPVLAVWLRQDHVSTRWRDSSADLLSLEDKYGPRIDRRHPIRVYVVEADAVAVGLIQGCPGSEYAWWPSELGLERSVVVDGLTGDPAYLARGLAPLVLRAFVDVCRADFPGAVAVQAGGRVRAWEGVRPRAAA